MSSIEVLGVAEIKFGKMGFYRIYVLNVEVVVVLSLESGGGNGFY